MNDEQLGELLFWLFILIGGTIAMAIVFVRELYCRDTTGFFYPRIWCWKNGLRFREGVALGICCTFWWGEDKDGNQYSPGADMRPELIKERNKPCKH